MSESVIVETYPKCDFCPKDEGVDAQYDGKTYMEPWASMCERHFKQYGIGLGTGRGQRYILEDEGGANDNV